MPINACAKIGCALLIIMNVFKQRVQYLKNWYPIIANPFVVIDLVFAEPPAVCNQFNKYRSK